MAENKKSFVLYADIISTIEKLNDVNAGMLFKHLLRYVNDMNPEPDNELIDIVFDPIKRQLKRDLMKFEKVKEKRSLAGKKGMVSRWKENNNDKQSITNDNNVIKCITNITDNDNDNDNVNDTVTQYSVDDFLNNWNELRAHFLKTPSQLNILQFAEKMQFNDLKHSYTKEDFQTALKGLFKQERLPMPVMTLNPKHFLNNFYQYLDAENNKAYNLYKSN